MIRKGFLFVLLMSAFSMLMCSGQTPSGGVNVQSIDSNRVAAIKNYLEKESTTLHFPNLTQSLYRQNNYKNIWFDSDEKQLLLWEAMSLLDCVAQYGLNPSSYHNTQLKYDNIRLITTSIAANSPVLKEETDILLTDALLAFMVHLHFGRLNPTISFGEIDNENFKGYRIDSVLKQAIQVPTKFSQTVLGVQPKTKDYRQLQDYLRLAIHQYAGECYEISEDTLKLIAINLERYKWYTTDEHVYVDINIPAFTLNFIADDSLYSFKIIVGKPTTPTPVLVSKIRYFTTAPYWTVPPSIFRKELLPKAIKSPSYLSMNNFLIYNQNGAVIAPFSANLKAIQKNPSAYIARQSPGRGNALGQIVFRFDNPYSIYLHDTPNHKLFNESYRALSHGCIRVEKAYDLVQLFLNADSAHQNMYAIISKSMNEYKRYQYTFKKQIPIIVGYITCSVKDGQLIKYPDLYKRDEDLTRRLFQSNLPATSAR